MGMRGLLSLLMFVLLSGCILTYRDVPVAASTQTSHAIPAPAPCHQTIRVSYGLTGGGLKGTLGGTYQGTYGGVFSPTGVTDGLEAALQQAAGCNSDPVDATVWPRTAVLVSVQEKPYRWHWYGEWLGRLSSLTYFIIPFYINEGGWELLYRVSHRDQSPMTNRYDITARQFYWVLLLPAAWMNLYTDSLEEAVESTTAPFVADGSLTKNEFVR